MFVSFVSVVLFVLLLFVLLLFLLSFSGSSDLSSLLSFPLFPSRFSGSLCPPFSVLRSRLFFLSFPISGWVSLLLIPFLVVLSSFFLFLFWLLWSNPLLSFSDSLSELLFLLLLLPHILILLCPSYWVFTYVSPV